MPEKFVRWMDLQQRPFFYGFVHYRTCMLASYNSNKHTSAPASTRLHLCMYKLDKCMWIVLPLYIFFFVCVHVSLSLPLSFFLYSHFLIKQNISPLDVTWMDSCAGGRGENQPQDMSKSEISSPKIRWETWVSVKGGKEKEREEGRSAEGWNKVLEKHVHPWPVTVNQVPEWLRVTPQEVASWSQKCNGIYIITQFHSNIPQ